MFSSISSLFLLFSLHQYPALGFTGGCLLEKGGGGAGHGDTTLQAAFVIDRTKSFDQYKKESLELSVGIRKSIQAIYSHSRFAMSSFADWEGSAGPATGNDEEKEVHTDVNACWDLHKSFNLDNSTVDGVIMGTIGLSNGGAENSLAALAFAAADKQIGWTRNPSKDKVRRVLILFTDQEYYEELKTPGTRTEFKGDGSDKCATSKPPTLQKVGEVLMQYEMPVIAVLLSTPKNEDLDLVEIYEEYFSNMPGVPFCSIGLKVDDIPKLDYDQVIEDCFNKLAGGCTPA